MMNGDVSIRKYKNMLLPKINLSNITYCGIDGRIKSKFIQLMINQAEFANNYIDFDEIIILTPRENHIDHEFIRFIDIPQLHSINMYNQFVLGYLNNYIRSDYCLLFQWDGCISHPHLWTNDFLKYDYIGAPWSQNIQEQLNKLIIEFQLDAEALFYVGNGGFSLRSKRLLKECQILFNNNRYLKHSEDILIGIVWRQILINKGYKFADIDTAKKFSIEYSIEPDHKYLNSFGFHHLNNLNKFISETKLIRARIY